MQAENVRVLVVDDDAAIRESMRFALEDAGYEVEEAEDGAAALHLLRAATERYVVLLDHLMPRLSGTGVLQQVQQEPSLAQRHAFVLVTASRSSFEDNELATDHLEVPVVRKPFALDDLLSAVARAAAGGHTP